MTFRIVSPDDLQDLTIPTLSCRLNVRQLAVSGILLVLFNHQLVN